MNPNNVVFAKKWNLRYFPSSIAFLDHARLLALTEKINVITNGIKIANGYDSDNAAAGLSPLIEIAMIVPTTPGPNGLGGVEPPGQTPNPINANSAVAPKTTAVCKSPRINPMPNEINNARLV